MVDGLFFCATLKGRRGGHTPFVQTWAESPTPVQRRLSRTHTILGRAMPGGWVACRGWKYTKYFPIISHSISHPPRAPHKSRRHGGALVGLAPWNKATIPPNWKMKHYKSMEFITFSNPKHPCTNVKSLSWRVSDNCPAPHYYWFRCQMNWWVVVRRGTNGCLDYSMDRWALSGADVQAPWHGVLETVWFQCDEAQQVGWLRGLEDYPLV